jgi:hypothetical protein
MDENFNIPHDDVTDVIEMTDKLEFLIHEILHGNEKELALSALMNACVNCLIGQCKTVLEARMLREVLVQVLDLSIENIKIETPEKPSS